MNSIRLKIDSEKAMQRFAALLSGVLKAGDTVLLEGDLGAGKSALARATIQSLPNQNNELVNEEVPSPTFTIVQTYERKIAEIWHFDLYRLANAEELYEIGIEEAIANQVCLIEWPDRLGHLTPPNHLMITIEFGAGEEERELQLVGEGSWLSRLPALALNS
jgi:tRNA threonylcarbamoyladenosine biosynthesis protein TsaE